jgi:hypothetical protein
VLTPLELGKSIFFLYFLGSENLQSLHRTRQFSQPVRVAATTSKVCSTLLDVSYICNSGPQVQAYSCNASIWGETLGGWMKGRPVASVPISQAHIYTTNTRVGQRHAKLVSTPPRVSDLGCLVQAPGPMLVMGCRNYDLKVLLVQLPRGWINMAWINGTFANALGSFLTNPLPTGRLGCLASLS